MNNQPRYVSALERDNCVKEVIRPLRHVLTTYYRVQGMNFFELDRQRTFQHQVLHLTKLLNKIVKYENDPDNLALQGILAHDVAPDLLIYAQEIYLKFGAACWRRADELTAGSDSLCTLLLHGHLPRFEGVLGLVSHAAATLADFCDCEDHGKPANHDLSGDVALAMTDAAAAIMQRFQLEPTPVYSMRIQSMIDKYHQWGLLQE